MLELRLLHHYTVSTGRTFSSAKEGVWTTLAPTIAFKNDFLMDAILAIAAQDLSRTDETDKEAAEASERYFDSALRGHMQALKLIDISQDVASAVLITSAIVNVYSLALTAMVPTTEPDSVYSLMRWLRVARGCRAVIDARIPWHAGNEVMLAFLEADPDMRDGALLFAPENRDKLQHLLDWGTEFETITEADRDAYEQTLSFVGFTHMSVDSYKNNPLVTCRCVLVLPSRCPGRFVELVEEKRPRALVILAHHFAALTLIKADYWWSRGVAERQIRLIYRLLPTAWKGMMEFPLQCISDFGRTT